VLQKRSRNGCVAPQIHLRNTRGAIDTFIYMRSAILSDRLDVYLRRPFRRPHVDLDSRIHRIPTGSRMAWEHTSKH
jgi:hypothetical protein